MRRITGRCAWCGAELRHGRILACASHADLPELDPNTRSETRRRLQQPPETPVLILTRKAA